MFSFFAKRALGSAASSVKNSLGGGSESNSNNESKEFDKSGGVDWSDTNWPWKLNLVHFDPWKDPIPSQARHTSLVMYYLLISTITILALNVLSTIILVAMKFSSGASLFSSFLQLIAGSGSCGVLLYYGYRCIGGSIRRLKSYYYAGQSILCIVMILFAIFSDGNLHGYMGMSENNPKFNDPKTQNSKTLVLIISGLESSLWILNACLASYVVYLVYQYPGHEIARAREGTVEKERKREKERERAKAGTEHEQDEEKGTLNSTGSKKVKLPFGGRPRLDDDVENDHALKMKSKWGKLGRM